MEKVHISLLTCGPGRQAYQLYGHTALRIEGIDFPFYFTHEREPILFNDVAVNWGMFSFKAKHFYLRFVFGLTDYHIAVEPMEFFMEEYEEEERWVVQQELNLAAEEKQRIIEAIMTNNLPENRVYRYNYFYDNCTTRADRMVRDHLQSRLSAAEADGDIISLYAPSYRKAIHNYNEHEDWARMGNDLLLGVMADKSITHEQSLFLPINLMNFYSQARIHEADSTRRLVLSETWLLPKQSGNTHPATHTPLKLAATLFVIILILTVLRIKKGWNLWLLDTLLLLAAGTGGLILTAMIFSQHPTVSLNLQILLLNPIALVCLYQLFRQKRKKPAKGVWKCYAVCILLFFLGNCLQHYAEGMNFLALSLLTRIYDRIHYYRK